MQSQIKFILSSTTRNFIIRRSAISSSYGVAVATTTNSTANRSCSTLHRFVLQQNNHGLISSSSLSSSTSSLSLTMNSYNDDKSSLVSLSSTTIRRFKSSKKSSSPRRNNSNNSSSSSSSSLHKKAVQALNQSKPSFKKSSSGKNNNATTTAAVVNEMTGMKVNDMVVNDEIIKEVKKNISEDYDDDAAAVVGIINGSHAKNSAVDESAAAPVENMNQVLQQQVPTTTSSSLKPAIHQGHLHEFAPRIVVVGVGGGGGNAVNNMIANQLHGVDFLALNTDAQHLSTILTDNRLQIGSTLTSGLGCGANPDAGRLAAEESKEQISELLSDAHMVFITAGMGGGTGTGAAPVVAELCYDMGILTVGVITKPFRFEGTHRMRLALEGIERLEKVVDTMIVIPNQNLFAMATDQTSFMDAFGIADNVLLAGVKSITDLMTAPGLINLDFADVQSVMHGMGNAMLGTGQASNANMTSDADGRKTERAILAAEQALANPLLGENMDIGTAKGMLVNITGGNDMTLFEVDRAAQCITDRIQDENANLIFGSAFDESLDGSIRVSVVATGIEEKKPC